MQLTKTISLYLAWLLVGLGHGYPLALEHPFTSGGATGTYANLMDYCSSTNLSFKQWGLAHNPKLKVRFGQGSEEGEYVNEIYFTPDWQAFIFRGDFLLSPNPRVPRGTVPNITKDNKLYRAVFAGDKFLHYAHSETDILALEIRPDPRPTDRVYLVEPVGQYSCYNVYRSSFQDIKALAGAPVDFNSRNLSYVYNTNGCENKDRDITPLGQEVLSSLKSYYGDAQHAERFARLTALVKKMAVGFDLYFSKAVLQDNRSILFDERYLDELITALEDQMGMGDIVRIINDPSTTPEQLLRALNVLGSESNRELSYAPYSVDQRIKMLQVFAKGKIRDEWIGFGNNAEAHVIWILKHTPQGDFPELLKKLETAKDATGKRNLLYVIDDQMDGDKYMELLATITQIIVTSSDFRNRGEDYQSHFVERILNWGGDARSLTDGYVRVREGVWSNYVKMDEQTGEISVEREERYRISVRHRDEFGVMDESVETRSRPYGPDVRLRPFDLVAFTNHGGLLEIDAATGARKGEQVYLPAIALVYANAKEFNENVGKTVNYAIDASTLISTGGTLTFAYKSLSWTRRAWLMYELASSAGNIAVNALELDKDPKLKKAVDLYNVFQGMLGASELVYNGRKSVPAALLKSGEATLASMEAVKEQARRFMLSLSNVKDEGVGLSLDAQRAREVCQKYSNELQSKWKTWFGEDLDPNLIKPRSQEAFDDDISGLVVTLDRSDDLAKARKWIGNVGDGKVYLAVHGEGDLFRITHNGQEYSLSHRSVARWITENKDIAPDAEIVLLTCANERAAQDLSNALKGNYRVTSWAGEVTVFANGHISGSGKCYTYQPSSTSGYNRTEISPANAPYGSNRSNAPPTADFVRLGTKKIDVGESLVNALVNRGIAKADADDLFLLLSYAQGKLKSNNPSLMERILKIIPNVNFKNPENLLVELKKCVNDNGDVIDMVAFEKFSKQVDDALAMVNKKGLAYIPPRTPTRLSGAIMSVYELGEAPKGTIMYHYTSAEGYEGILSSKKLRPSLTTSVPNHAHFGNGYYLSDIPLNTKTLEDLSKDFVRNANEGDRFAYCVAIDVSGMKIFQAVGDRSAVFLIEGVSDLDLSSRLILSKCGKNTKLK